MDIYSSDKAVPYVYICTHKETGKFYIGYRMANVKLNIPSHLDLPEYKTSSTTVRPDWSNYTWTIVAEFFDPSDAYTFEQQSIFDNWENPLLLNGHYSLSETQFRTSGTFSDEHRKKLSDAKKGKPSDRKGKPISTKHRKKISDARKGMKLGPHSAETKQKMSDAKKGKTLSVETKQKMSDVRKGRKQKLVECPHCGLVGGISNMTRKHFDNCKMKPI